MDPSRVFVTKLWYTKVSVTNIPGVRQKYHCCCKQVGNWYVSRHKKKPPVMYTLVNAHTTTTKKTPQPTREKEKKSIVENTQ